MYVKFEFVDDDGEASDDSGGYDIVESEQVDNWDCESVLSLRSNTTNHPSRVDRLRVGKPTKSRKKKTAILGMSKS